MSLASITGELLLGWLAADFLTGIFHWWEDNFGREDWPVIGPWLIAPNRLHHVDPLAFTTHGFIDRNGASIIAAAVIGLLAVWSVGPSCFLAAALIGGGLSNEVHRYAHQPSITPPWLRMFQQTGLVQSPKTHAAHHRPPYDANYCVLTDWLNPVLEMIGLWKRLELMLDRTVGA